MDTDKHGWKKEVRSQNLGVGRMRGKSSKLQTLNKFRGRLTEKEF
jgi:hypothetical protein